MNRLFARWFPARGRHREPRSEPPSKRHVCTRACDRKYGVDYFGHGCPDADPAAPTVLLRPVLHPDAWHGPTTVLPDTAAPSTTDGAVTRDHEGATEEFAAVLAGMREDLAHDTGDLDPESRAWDEAFAALDRRLADAHIAFVRRWVAEVDSLAERVAPGWRSEPRVPVDSFEEARELAGVFVMPARAIDYSTAEWPLVGAS